MPTRGAGRVRTPTVIQMESVECGAASLGIVLGAFGRFVPLEKLRLDCGVSRDGSKASNILEAAEGYGLIGKGFRKTPEQLREVPLPAIVFWRFTHFLVLEGFGKKKVFINDPETGPRTISHDELARQYSGVVLTFEKGPGFQKGGRRASVLQSLEARLKNDRASVLLVVLAALCLVIPGLVIPLFARLFVDEVLMASRSGWLAPLLLGLGVTAAMRAATTWLQESTVLRLETKLAVSGSCQLVWHVLRLPVPFFTQRPPGLVAWRIAVNDRLATLLSGDLASGGLNLISVVFFGLVLFSYDVGLASVALLTAALNFAALLALSRRRVDANHRLSQELAKVTSTTMTGLQIIETLKATAGETDYFVRWAGQQAKAGRTQQELGETTQALSVIPGILGTVSTAVILGLGGLRVMDGALTMGALVAFQSLMASFLDPIARFVELGSKLQNVRADLAQIDDVFHNEVEPWVPAEITAREIEETDGGPVKLRGELELVNVVFGYSRLDPPLLQDFSLRLRPGSRVALVGTTGSGKSTVARLVTGLYRPWSGEVLLDGSPRDLVPYRLLLSSLGMVDQEIFLFEATVRENLSLWDPSVSEARIARAAKDACIHDVIAARPQGYQSRVEEGGANFSGGQRQRLEIARALVADPSILVMDEATSALDPVLEKRVDDNLRRRGCTTLIIAHRLSTIRDCDEIVVMDRGRVVQRGVHDAMVEAEGPYRDLILAEERTERESLP
jgi:NHLM bacteriocin system ABC transporter peptidase/ATP-binding protein